MRFTRSPFCHFLTVVLVMCFSLSFSGLALAVPDKPLLPDKRPNVMPASKPAPGAKVTLTPTRTPQVFSKTGFRYDEKGRLVEQRTNDMVKVITYQGEGRDNRTEFVENKARGCYSIHEYIGGKLYSVTYSTGEFQRYDNGLLSQRITSTGTIYDYFYEKKSDGSVYKTFTHINGKYYSTTTQVDRVTTEVEYASGLFQRMKNCLLVYSRDAKGIEWEYRYEWDKQGRLERRIGTRLNDGFVSIFEYKNGNRGNNAPVNFQKVQQAALKSVQTGSESVKTSDGNTYLLSKGALQLMRKEDSSTYKYTDRVLAEIKLANGKQIRLDQSGRYVAVKLSTTAR